LQSYSEKFDIVRFESAALILLCNIKPQMREYALQMISTVHTLANELVEINELEKLPATLQDVLNETSAFLIKKIETKLTFKHVKFFELIISRKLELDLIH
jgi:hypothetical protein